MLIHDVRTYYIYHSKLDELCYWICRTNRSFIIIIYDDLDLDFGRVKKSFDSEAAGHRGVDDIIRQTGTKSFTRIRFGIGRPENKSQVNDYVLSNFSKTELEAIIALDVFSLL